MGRTNRFRRNRPTRSPLPTASCAVEGKNTEPEYIGALARSRELGKRFRIVPSHSDPMSVVRSVAASKKASEARGEYCDHWFAVFDREFTEDRAKSIERARELAAKRGIECIENRPSFEYWLRLHFSRDDRPYASQEDVERDLRRYVLNFGKQAGMIAGVMDVLLERVDAACRNAEWVVRYGVYGNGSDMPALVNVINNMQDPRRM